MNNNLSWYMNKKKTWKQFIKVLFIFNIIASKTQIKMHMNNAVSNLPAIMVIKCVFLYTGICDKFVLPLYSCVIFL